VVVRFAAPFQGCVVVLAACQADERAAAESTDEREIGAPCSRQSRKCGEHGELIECQDGYWAEADCEQQCSDREWLGCREIEGSGSCMCGPRPASGPPPIWQEACLDANTLLECPTCAPSSCDDICAQDEPSSVSLGCFETDGDSASCLCRPDAVACADGSPPRCDGAVALATCEAGTWALESCVALCAPVMTLGCRLAEDGSSACACGEPEEEE